MKDKYQKTIYACFIGYVVQAVVNNFVPLLFLTFEKTYGIPLSKITMLITLNFGVQLIVDLLSAGLVDKIGYSIDRDRTCGIRAGTDRTGRTAKPFTECVYRNSIVCYDLCDRRRSDRSTDQSDHGELPDRQQRKSDESVAFILLLGTCSSCTDLHLLF